MDILFHGKLKKYHNKAIIIFDGKLPNNSTSVFIIYILSNMQKSILLQYCKKQKPSFIRKLSV